MAGYAFTLCRSADGALATKALARLPDGTISKTSSGRCFLWTFTTLSAADNAGLAALLIKLSSRPDAMIVMGTPVPELNLAKPHRRLFAATAPIGINTLMPVDRAWIVLDLDDITVPVPLGEGSRLREAAEHIRDRMLPPEFCGIECVVCASSSSGLKGPGLARMKLFFLLDKSEPLTALKNWASGAKAAGLPVDPAVLQAGQPIYVARPIFKDLADPVPPHLHAFVLGGIFGDRVKLDVHRYDAVVVTIGKTLAAAEKAAGGDWRKLLEATLGGPTSFFEPLSRALGLAVRSGEPEADIVSFTRSLLTARADPARLSEYDEQWIKRSLRSFANRDAAQRQRIGRLRSELFSSTNNNREHGHAG